VQLLCQSYFRANPTNPPLNTFFPSCGHWSELHRQRREAWPTPRPVFGRPPHGLWERFTSRSENRFSTRRITRRAYRCAHGRICDRSLSIAPLLAAAKLFRVGCYLEYFCNSIPLLTLWGLMQIQGSLTLLPHAAEKKTGSGLWEIHA